ncbi:hypothetical protein F4678DRAFT_443552 [Xylaria arbuscula]|nr:hypothetical protein F4678DRAFT_443552 [Xylaria arbuscula]
MDISEKARENSWATDLARAVQDNKNKRVTLLLELRDSKIAKTRSQRRRHGKLFGAIGLVDALYIAIEKERSQLAILLIRAEGAELTLTRPSLTRPGDSHRTPLHEAAKWENITIVTELLDHSECARNINIKDKDGRVALHEAAARSNLDIVQVLLAGGANVDTRDAYGITPLHLMVYHRLPRCSPTNDTILDTLVASGADVNTKDNTGSTPLHAACTHGDFHLATALLLYGADAGAEDADGKTPQAITPEKYEDLHQKLDWFQSSETKSVAHIPLPKPFCPKSNKKVCDTAPVYIRWYSRKNDKSWGVTTSISDLIYDEQPGGETGLQRTIEEFREIVLQPPSEGGEWKWIHLHANNMTWVKDLIWRITHSEGYNPDEQSEVWRFWERTIDAKKTGAESKRAPHAQDSWEEDQLRSSVNDSTEDASSEEHRTYFPKKRKLSLVLPFIDIEARSYLNREPQGQMKKTMDLLECYGPYDGRGGLQVPRTLDGSYYDMLEPKRIQGRDKQQILLKWFETQKGAWGLENEESECPPQYSRNSQSNENSAGTLESHSATNIVKGNPIPYVAAHRKVDDLAKLLMVHQLWLWKLDDNTVITCCPDRCHSGPGNTLIDTIRQSGINAIREPDDLIERILYECTKSVDELHSAGLGAHIFDIFDYMIASRSDEESVHFEQFKDGMRRRDRKKNQNITPEINLLYEVKDIRDELKLLKRIFVAQYRVLSNFTRLFWPGDQTRRDGFLEDCAVKAVIDRTDLLDENAKSTLDDLDYLIQVKQSQSALDEAEASRRLNNNIFLFTIVTIIFTPLSFIASLFALPVKQFPHDGDSNLSYDSLWITQRMFAGELTTLAVIAAITIFQWRHSLPTWHPFDNSTGGPGPNLTHSRKKTRKRSQPDEEAAVDSND